MEDPKVLVTPRRDHDTITDNDDDEEEEPRAEYEKPQMELHMTPKIGPVLPDKTNMSELLHEIDEILQEKKEV